MSYFFYLKGEERFIIAFTDDTLCEAYMQIMRWACNPQIDFDAVDVIKATRQLRMMSETCVGK